MKIFAVLGGEKTKPIQSQTKPIRVSPQIYLGVEKQNQSRPLAGNPKHEVRNPKRVEMLFEKTKPIFEWAK